MGLQQLLGRFTRQQPEGRPKPRHQLQRGIGQRTGLFEELQPLFGQFLKRGLLSLTGTGAQGRIERFRRTAGEQTRITSKQKGLIARRAGLQVGPAFDIQAENVAGQQTAEFASQQLGRDAELQNVLLMLSLMEEANPERAIQAFMQLQGLANQTGGGVLDLLRAGGQIAGQF